MKWEINKHTENGIEENNLNHTELIYPEQQKIAIQKTIIKM